MNPPHSEGALIRLVCCWLLYSQYWPETSDCWWSWCPSVYPQEVRSACSWSWGPPLLPFWLGAPPRGPNTHTFLAEFQNKTLYRLTVLGGDGTWTLPRVSLMCCGSAGFTGMARTPSALSSQPSMEPMSSCSPVVAARVSMDLQGQERPIGHVPWWVSGTYYMCAIQ